MARTSFSTTVSTIVSSLEIEMKELNLLGDEYHLTWQIGSPTYGNSYWVAVTGGQLGTGISIIDSLHMDSDTKRDNWLQCVKAYRNALGRVRLQRKQSTELHANVALGWSQI